MNLRPSRILKKARSGGRATVLKLNLIEPRIVEVRPGPKGIIFESEVGLGMYEWYPCETGDRADPRTDQVINPPRYPNANGPVAAPTVVSSGSDVLVTFVAEGQESAQKCGMRDLHPRINYVQDLNAWRISGAHVEDILYEPLFPNSEGRWVVYVEWDD